MNNSANGTFLVGRIILGGYYLYSALNHFAALPMLSAYTRSKGVPLAELAVLTSGILLAIGGLSMLLGVYPRVGVAALVLFLVPVTVIMHAFWIESDPMARTAQLVQFLKNFGLIGSALMFVAIPEPWPYSLGARIGRRHIVQPA